MRQANVASVVRAPSRPFRFAGFPLGAWAFGLRTWLAMVTALYVAFWLQLQSASSAAVCVGILSLPKRGQAFQKAVYRFLGTVVGVAASIVCAGLFNEIRTLLILSYASWLGLCVFAAGLFDGNRAYGAVLSGYTVAIVAVASIDAPQNVFTTGIDRGAAITVGILALAFINDLFAAPDIYPELIGKLEAAHRKVRDIGLKALRSGELDPDEVAGLFKKITALHPDITALPAESISGRARAATARTAVLALVHEVGATHALSSTLAGRAPTVAELRAELAAALEEHHQAQAEAVRARLREAVGNPDADGKRLIAIGAATVLLELDKVTTEALGDMRDGRGRAHGPPLPAYRSRHAAARAGLRAFLAVAISSFVFVLTGWPATSFALTILSATMAISATVPNPRAFASAALIAGPLAVLVSGVTEFLILDGVDQFSLLAIALGPTVLGACLLMASGNQKLAVVGSLSLIFVPILLSPTNPQTYDPQSFLFVSVLVITAIAMLVILLSTLLPTSDQLRAKWILASVQRDLRETLLGRPGQRSVVSAYRDADRIGQFSALTAEDPAVRDGDLRFIMHAAALTSSVRRMHAAIESRAVTGNSACMAQVSAALGNLDPGSLRRAAAEVLVSEDTQSPDERAASRRMAADLAWAAILIERNPADLERPRRSASS